MASPSHLHFFFPIPSALLRYLLLLLFALPPSLSFSPRCHISSAEAREEREERGAKKGPFPPLGFWSPLDEKKGGRKERNSFSRLFFFLFPFPPTKLSMRCGVTGAANVASV